MQKQNHKLLTPIIIIIKIVLHEKTRCITIKKWWSNHKTFKSYILTQIKDILFGHLNIWKKYY